MTKGEIIDQARIAYHKKVFEIMRQCGGKRYDLSAFSEKVKNLFVYTCVKFDFTLVDEAYNKKISEEKRLAAFKKLILKWVANLSYEEIISSKPLIDGDECIAIHDDYIDALNVLREHHSKAILISMLCDLPNFKNVQNFRLDVDRELSRIFGVKASEGAKQIVALKYRISLKSVEYKITLTKKLQNLIHRYCERSQKVRHNI